MLQARKNSDNQFISPRIQFFFKRKPVVNEIENFLIPLAFLIHYFRNNLTTPIFESA